MLLETDNFLKKLYNKGSGAKIFMQVIQKTT